MQSVAPLGPVRSAYLFLFLQLCLEEDAIFENISRISCDEGRFLELLKRAKMLFPTDT